MRIADGDAYELAVEKGELVLRETPSGTRQVKARFFETSRHIQVLTLQRWNDKTGRSSGPCSFPLVGDEIRALLSFIQDVQKVRLPSGRLVIEQGALEHAHFTDESLLQAMRGKSELLRAILRTETTVGDVKAWAFRKKSLDEFSRLLDDQDYFNQKQSQAANQSAERVWQDFFQGNKWIFGYGLSYIFLSAVDPERLQQAVAGYSVAWKGSRPDALMKTRGAVSALCLVEIKTHQTPLVGSKPERSGAFTVSRELADALSQSQAAVLAAERQLMQSFKPVDQVGNPVSDRIYNYRPRALLVTGRLSEFATALGLNEEKYASFEMFRRNLVTPEIVTYDELYERAKYIVEHTDDN